MSLKHAPSAGGIVCGAGIGWFVAMLGSDNPMHMHMHMHMHMRMRMDMYMLLICQVPPPPGLAKRMPCSDNVTHKGAL